MAWKRLAPLAWMIWLFRPLFHFSGKDENQLPRALSFFAFLPKFCHGGFSPLIDCHGGFEELIDWNNSELWTYHEWSDDAPSFPLQGVRGFMIMTNDVYKAKNEANSRRNNQIIKNSWLIIYCYLSESHPIYLKKIISNLSRKRERLIICL